MIDLERLKQITEVYFHQSCPDGTASAMICKKAFDWLCISPTFHPVQYQTDFFENLCPKPGQMFIDITPPRARWREWEESHPIVLDHHESAKEATIGLGGVYATNDRHSGAMLAFENVMLPIALSSLDQAEACMQQWKEFAEVAMIRDTWKNTHEKWELACIQAEALNLFGPKLLLEKIENDTFSFGELYGTGLVFFEKTKRKAEVIAKEALWDEIIIDDRAIKLASFNCTEKIISEVGNLLKDQGSDVSIAYFFKPEGEDLKVVVSLRTSERIQANKVCETYGGGGHARAAGFTMNNGRSVAPSTIVESVKDSIRKTFER